MTYTKCNLMFWKRHWIYIERMYCNIIRLHIVFWICPYRLNCRCFVLSAFYKTTISLLIEFIRVLTKVIMNHNHVSQFKTYRLYMTTMHLYDWLTMVHYSVTRIEQSYCVYIHVIYRIIHCLLQYAYICVSCIICMQ